MNKELIRLSVLEYLAERATAAYQATQMARMMNLRGMADEKLDPEDVREALIFLEGLGFVKQTFGPLGNSTHWQITSDGVLHHERGA